MTRTIDVPVKETDKAWIHFMAQQRQDSAIAKGRRGAYGSVDAQRGDLKKDMMGCWGEMAVARAFRLFWDATVGEIHAADVGQTLEVRSIHERGRCLILHDADKLHPEKSRRPFILAFIGEAYSHQRITLCGYGIPRLHLVGRTLEQRGSGAPAYYIKERELRCMGEIYEHVREFER